jgi:hypothetical protein
MLSGFPGILPFSILPEQLVHTEDPLLNINWKDGYLDKTCLQVLLLVSLQIYSNPYLLKFFNKKCNPARISQLCRYS